MKALQCGYYVGFVHVEREDHTWSYLPDRIRQCDHCGKEELRTPRGTWIDQACGARSVENSRTKRYTKRNEGTE